MKKFKLSLSGVSLVCTLGIAAALTGLPQIGFSAGGGAELEHFSPVRTDKSLQRGAKIFVNYCQGCHTADYQRYSRLAEDIGISDKDMSENMIFTTDANGCLLYTSPSPRDATLSRMPSSA